MIVGDLLAHIGFKTETGPLEKLEGQLESIKEKINLVIGFEAFSKLYELAERFAHWGEELHVTAVNIGLTTDSLQGLDFAAEHAGVSQEMMAHSLAHLSRELYHAKTGSAEAMMAFAKAGFSSETLARFKTSEDALYALADRINAIQDPLQRMGVAQTLLGRGGFKMIAFLSQGSAKIKEQAGELKRLGLQLSGPQVEALVQTEHAFIRLKSVMSAMGAQIASYVGPAFSYLVDKFIQLYDANQNLAHGGIKAWLDILLYGLGYAAGFVLEITRRLGGMGAAIQSAFKSGGMAGVFDKITDKVDQLIHRIFSPENLKAFTDKIQEVMSSETFAKALQTSINAALILTGFAANIGIEIARGIGLGLWTILSTLFGKNVKSLLLQLVSPFKAPEEGTAAGNFIEQLLAGEEELKGEKSKGEGASAIREALKTMGESTLSHILGNIGEAATTPAGESVITSPGQIINKIVTRSAPPPVPQAPAPIATTAPAALGGSVTNKTTVGGDINITHGPTSIHVVVPPGTTPAQTKAHAEKAAEGVYNVKDAQARRAAQQSLVP